MILKQIDKNGGYSLNLMKLLFSVSFYIIKVKYDNFFKAVLELGVEGQVLVNNTCC